MQRVQGGYLPGRVQRQSLWWQNCMYISVDFTCTFNGLLLLHDNLVFTLGDWDNGKALAQSLLYTIINRYSVN